MDHGVLTNEEFKKAMQEAREKVLTADENTRKTDIDIKKRLGELFK